MDLDAVEELREDLDAFCAEVFASIPRRDSRQWGGCYLRGLMLDGRRKSIQPMAERLPDGNMQALQQFVASSPWEHTPVRRRIATKVSQAINPDAWVIDDTSFPKAGNHSAGAVRQWCGALGKKSLCQVGVSLHAVTDAASVPLDWRLFLPKEWADPADARRAKTGIPDGVGHREKWRLALDMIDQARSWGLQDQVVVADAGYGQNHAFREGLAERGLDYVVAVREDVNAHPGQAVPHLPERRKGRGCPPQPRYRTPARSLKELALEQGRGALRRCTWRQGSRGSMRGRFLVMAVRPAGAAAHKAALEKAGGRSGWDGVLPPETLIAEWPPHHEAPTDYWLSSLPADTVLRHLVRLAKIRWRIEHDYRELKHGLGLDHYEGRTWRGWHHHVTLVTAAQAFLTLRRLDPKTQTSV
ncbi:IS701 family transposase [Nocardiopsis metallicus]|uniref:SRSO17 transposase n=2 Tax=Nocardiopsis metallicus TaxID=179819 RepID=A0A840WBG3_9ACTN|nr:IS701 family transposase [Nocardiopsis metallicus]MBB5490995.1 SRSO17 transposase [Nocardiopsis metallicus]MBB5493494.1 SRSO17 transposase [Nocardiopsis metallicus]MBB5495505.1 SRSO17 transposase [Nocardiopsis metallicus]